MENRYLILAGDARLHALDRLLRQKGARAQHLQTPLRPEDLREKIKSCNILILPTPLSKDERHLFTVSDALYPLSDVFESCHEKQTVFAGALTDAQKAALEATGARCVDFLRLPSFALQNAHFTAQGALRLMLEHTTSFLPQCRVLITGFGKLGKSAAQLLRAVGCRVSVAARSAQQRSEASLLGCCPLSFEELPSTLFLFDFILNTVPAPLFSGEMFRSCKQGCVYLELASAPYGAAQSSFAHSGVHYVFAGSLPGRFCSAGCAKAMLEQIELHTRTGGD